ncbi:MAG: mechanosensitive ion channel [Edaphobacter sp.]|uniref:mechanosensitive ion channel domain-containing protein n=1 Tax=Edaphobacter sp. TaxID=1934404 RepID=UPI00239E97E7|nr:mechanosensitive ion channel domain-containing protein [Edaphobacter sp.]MDE1176316.1 mechanosensitive ion channel [Edaphobacter sp.]
MNRRRKLMLFLLLGVFALTLAGTFLTRGVMAYLPFLEAKKNGWTGDYVSHGLVDQRPWQTAATLAALAHSAEEKELARESERLADHEVDQAFSQSLRQASLDKPPLTGRALTIQQRIVQLQQTIKADESQIAELKTAAAGGASNDLDVAKAQLELDQNELTDATEDLARVSSDQTVKLQQELAARKAAMTKYVAQASKNEGQSAVTAAEQYKTLAQQVSAWWSHRSRRDLIAQAGQLARSDAAALSGDQVRLHAQADALAKVPDAGESRTERVDRLQRMTAMQNILSILSDRLDAQQQLVSLYDRWGQQVEIQDKIVIHLILRSLAVIAAICVLTLLVGWGLQVLLERMLREVRQKQTMKTILNLGVQVVGLVMVLLVILGVPQQMPTILGLATAGLTVVFQDFILAFCGWFVLMGPNGIRVRDWVEIDGVGGEVVELGLFRTWLLETGNWTANGHPTGRRVSFLNGYAIRGRYFNFSTVGQWMWDEIKVSIPAGTRIHPLVERVYEASVEATEADAKMAEAEWKRVTHEEGSPQFSAMPSVNLRPAGSGVDLVIRYITRAGVRLHTRNELFETIVELMQAPQAEGKEEA